MSPADSGHDTAAGKGARRRSGPAAITAAVFATLTVAACSGTNVTVAEPAAAPVRVVVVDPIVADKPEWQRLAHRVRRQLIVDLGEDRSFERVEKAVPDIAPPDLIRVDGRIEALDPGADFLATLAGDVGWGGAELRARFRIRGRDDQVYADFTQTVSASRPLAETTVIGTVYTPHFDPLYADDLADALAAEAADTIAAWAAGEEIR